uniref:helix-turn-helix domain-containing protein n=1 Tax=Nocardioides stalactiti TaxID=2755356 RepID=UPI0016005E23
MTRTTTRTCGTAAAGPTSLAAYRARTTGLGAAATTTDVVGLHAHFAAAATIDEDNAHLHAVVAAVLVRARRVGAADIGWQRFVTLIDRHRNNPRAMLNSAVLANLIGIATFGDARDFVTLDDLGDRIGGERLAAVQHRAARFVERDATYPMTTLAVARMVAADAHPVARTSLDAAVALLAEGIDPDQSLPVIRTSAQLRGVVDGGSVLEWRHHLAMIAASPWSPYSDHLLDMALQAELPQVVAVVERFTELCRAQNKEREREQVADEVRRLVAASGVTQRQFAKWVGTSPSRLSTYVSGSVTPSASLMLRMTRTSRLLQERDVHETLTTAMSEQSWGAARAAVDTGGIEGVTGPGARPAGA